ncbi:MAG: ABC transporter permease [Desulfobacterales bacterium]|nr:ABC transporter permease [Desulfobacterales bacterium]MBS3755870.1 ABC transporter permease [Desulfobacterales bacterium]
MIDVCRRALSDFYRHRYLHGVCLFTIALSVFIISAFSLFFINAGELMGAWQQGIRITAYLKPDVTKKQAADLAADIEQYPGVASVSYVSGKEGLAWLKEQLGTGSSLLSDLKENPLPDALEIHPAKNMAAMSGADRLAGKIAEFAEVSDVEYAREWMQRFYGIYNLFKVTAFVMAGLVFVAILFIVANTIRLILYSRREEIEITRIIGADEAFIKHPLYLEALMLGSFGGVAGLAMLYGAFFSLMPKLSPEGLLPFFRVRFLPLELVLAILISSMFVGWLGCYFSIRRFLRA